MNEPKSFRPEFEINGHWYPTAIRFATEGEAMQNARDKFAAWTSPTAYRVRPSDDAPNYRYEDHQLIAIEGAS